MNRCMKECDRRGASTIAFPAIGTGNLGFPVATAAHIMVDEVCNYLERNKCKSLSMVYFIIFMKDMYQTFCEVLHRRKQQSGFVAAQSHIHKVTTMKQKESRNVSHDVAVKVIAVEGAIKLGNGISVKFLIGDISSEATDAIVNSTSREMNLKASGGVSAALLKKGGKELKKACKKKANKKQYLTEGKVIDTESGNLHCKRVFHIFFQKEFHIEDIVRVCINRAVELNYRSISFPAIGTGVGGLPPDASARGFIIGLRQCKPPYELHVRIVLKNDKVYQAFQAMMDFHLSTWYQRTIKTMKNWIWGRSESIDEEDNEPMDDNKENETDMELQIFGETEESVKSAEDSLHTLISNYKQFKTEDERIGLLKPDQEKLLQEKACGMQLKFCIDRSINTIELTGNTDSIDDMKLEIEKALIQVDKDASSEGLPDDWESMVDPSSGKIVPLRVVDLPATNKGYKFALAEFHKTMKQGSNYKMIVKIQRIQNPGLYGQYTAKKKRLETHNPAGVQNERWLFHGTKESSISQINKTNFNRSFRGQNGMYTYNPRRSPHNVGMVATPLEFPDTLF